MLDPRVLRQVLSPLFSAGSMPTGGIQSAVNSWMSGYSVYAQAASAGAAVLAAPLAAPPATGADFISSLDSAMRGMWMAAAWVGPGVIGTTAVVPPIGPPLLANSGILIRSADPQQALSLIADAIHTYTLSITVTLVPATGTPLIVPLL